MIKLIVSDEIIQEAFNIVEGVYSPLQGFLHKKELDSVLHKMRLENGNVWPMPILMDISKEEYHRIGKARSILIENQEGNVTFRIDDISLYQYDMDILSEKLFGTLDISHPGAAKFSKMKPFLVSGILTLVYDRRPDKFPYYFSPQESRAIFRKNNWPTIAAFQTRNPPHRSHEHLQKSALEVTEGLFINPIIGEKKSGDFSDKHILEAYKLLIRDYFPDKKVVLGTFHTFMRYAGPKEALFHAIVRRNFGCTHMIIGRDHAGVGSYYGTYDAQKIFDNFSLSELGIEILKFENAVFCDDCAEIVFENQCSHNNSSKSSFSASLLRESFREGKAIFQTQMRKNVADYLAKNKETLFV